MHNRLHMTALASALTLAVSAGAIAADLPNATQKALADLKLDASLMDGLDAELAVPQAWIDAAAKEKQVDIFGTWNEREFRTMTTAFRERYPNVNLRYNRTGTAGRGMKVLVALAEGRVIADVLTSIADATSEFVAMKALADLRELPGFKNISSDYVAIDGTWASFKLSFRCMAYNTEKVKKEDLPATWDDLVKNPRWGRGNIALANLPDSWLLSLWGGKGEAWGADFTRALFALQPQRRKEGMTAVTALTVAGEFDANIPAPEWVTQQYVEKGAPISYHCPAPVPINVSQIAMMEKANNKNGARLFVNWMISREGQLVQYADTFSVPVHKDLQLPRFLPFSDTIVGKPYFVRDDALLNGDMNTKMSELWESLWATPAGGKTAR